MKKQYSISFYLDTRREKENSKFPVKLRVYANQIMKQKLYPTKFEYTKNEFKSIWETIKPRNEHKTERLKLQKLEDHVDEIAKTITPFSFEIFEKKMYLKKGQSEDVFYQYSEMIRENKEINRLGNAQNYDLSLKSLKAFIKYSSGKEPKKIRFVEINKFWLDSYENYMLNVLNRSHTTVSIYLRALRAVFNKAIRDKEIPEDIYPFGSSKGKYQVPAVKKVKKALNSLQIKKLFDAEPQTPEQEKAKDFWFFSYACSGMNIKDIALLKYENLSDNKLVYFRAKTINTSKANLKEITVYLNDYTNSIIDKYGNKNKNKKNYIFDILNINQKDEIKFKKIKNFTRFINQNLKKLAIKEGLPSEISTYWARHTFSTIAIRNGASMEFISKSLNHSNMRTTENYFEGFEDEAKKDFSNNIMNF